MLDLLLVYHSLRVIVYLYVFQICLSLIKSLDNCPPRQNSSILIKSRNYLESFFKVGFITIFFTLVHVYITVR